MRTNRIRIRRARPADCTTLSRIADAAKRHWGYPDRWMRLWKADLTVTPETIAAQSVYCAVRGSALAGFYAVSGDGRSRELEHMWVRPGEIGSGVGRALFRHLVRLLERTGASRLVIASDPNAQGFYRRMGARPAGAVASAPAGRKLPRLVFHVAPRPGPMRGSGSKPLSDSRSARRSRSK